MGKTSRRKSESVQRQAEELRRQSALIPFHLVFGVAWLLFGIVALVYGFSNQDRGALTAGGAVSFLGVLLLGRAVSVRRKVRAEALRDRDKTAPF